MNVVVAVVVVEVVVVVVVVVVAVVEVVVVVVVVVVVEGMHLYGYWNRGKIPVSKQGYQHDAPSP